MNGYMIKFNSLSSEDQTELRSVSSKSTSSVSDQSESTPVVRLILKWINNILEEDNMQKISDLKELSNGQVFIKIIRSKLDNQTITSVYTPSVNYYLIKKYFLEKFSVSCRDILFDSAQDGDTTELTKIGLVLLLSSDNQNISPQDQDFFSALKRNYQKSELKLSEIINAFLEYTASDCEELLNDYSSQNSRSHFLKLNQLNNSSSSSVSESFEENFRSEILRLNEELSLEKSKNEKLASQNLELQNKLKESNRNFYNEEILCKKLKIKCKDTKNLLKEYEDQLIECQKQIQYLNSDYEMINSELVSMKKKIIRANQRSESIVKHQKSNENSNRTREFPTDQNNFAKESVQLKNLAKYYKSRYLELRKQVVLSLNSTVNELIRKNETFLEGNAFKMKKFEQDMEKKLQNLRNKNEIQGIELANLELKEISMQGEKTNLIKNIEERDRRIEEYEALNRNMLVYIQLQTNEIRELDDILKKSKFTNSFLDLRVKNLTSNVYAGMDNNEKQIKELYDTITEVFIERIEELKNENDQLKNDVKKLAELN